MTAKVKRVYGGVEAGGTKFVCAVGNSPGDILAKAQFPTTTPRETIAKAIGFFRETGTVLSGIGIASFGPLDLKKDSPAYGCITTTPKPGWTNTNLVKPFKDTFNIPVTLDTDVNGAALGEGKWGAAQGLDTFIYLTIGTGIGGGGLLNGKPAHGLVHPEMGHMLIPHDREKDPFPGACPYHGDCWEGLAGGPAITKRWGVPTEALPPTHKAWQLEAEYIAYGVTNMILALSPQKVILGGGIMKVPGLLEKVQEKVKLLLHNYVNSTAINDKIEDYIVAPELGDMAGALGAIALAEM